MKKLLIVFLFFSMITASAQVAPKNFCIKSSNIQECISEVILTVADYSFDSIDSTFQKNYKAYVYKNTSGETLVFLVVSTITGADPDLKIPGTKIEVIKSIKAQFLTMHKLYAQYFGRSIQIDKLKKDGDYWQFKSANKNGSITVDPSSEPGYWNMRISY